MPVQWINGWPIPGVPDKDSVGTIQWSAKKPINGSPITFPQGSDEFNSPVLSPKWQWNYQPKPEKYSLTQRKGYLRLFAYKPLKTDSFFFAGSTICQRYFKCDSVTTTVKIDISNMEDGQKAGIAHFNGGVNYTSIEISQKKGAKRLRFDNNHQINYFDTIPQITKVIYFRMVIDSNLNSRFGYSTNGKIFIPWAMATN